jgi:hypothetical protein
VVAVALAQAGQVAGDLGGGDLGERADAGPGQRLLVAGQVPPVGAERVRRQRPLDGQVVEVSVDNASDVAQVRTSSSLT